MSRYLLRALFLAALFAAPCAARAATQVSYVVDDKTLRAAISGTILQVDFYGNGTCAGLPLASASLPIDDFDMIERLKRFRPIGGAKPPNAARLTEVIDAVSLQGTAIWASISGTGILPLGSPCQFQYASSPGTSLPCASQVGNEVYFQGCNVNIRNGAGSTYTTNGLGNLVMGYNEDSPPANDRGGSHTVVIGTGHTYPGAANLITGDSNNADGDGVVVFGSFNAATGYWATVTGGYSNTASGVAASVSGGASNEASGTEASISGGSNNAATNRNASVSGGSYNNATGIGSSVSGGEANAATGSRASVSGGLCNIAGAGPAPACGSGTDMSSVSGGKGNVASGAYSTVTGGTGNTANGSYASVSGGQCNVAGSGSAPSCSALAGVASVSGGSGNVASGDRSSVSGGGGNTASATEASVSGGLFRSSTGAQDWRAGGLFQDN